MTDRKTRFLLAKQLEESRAIRDSLTPRDAPQVPPNERLCEDCPPVGYPTDITRCAACPRRAHMEGE